MYSLLSSILRKFRWNFVLVRITLGREGWRFLFAWLEEQAGGPFLLPTNSFLSLAFTFLRLITFLKSRLLLLHSS